MVRTTLPRIEVQPFEADLDGITEIQKRIFDNAQDFCLWRKGEFDNIIEIFQHVSDFVATHKYFILAVAQTILIGISTFIALRERLDRKRKEKAEQDTDRPSYTKPILLAIVSVRTQKNASYLDKFRDLRASVNEIPEDKNGRLRYFVTEKEFCFFFRRAENDFVGFTGSDRKVQDWLIGLFSADCEISKQPN